MEAHVGVEVHFHASLTSAPDKDEWLDSRAARITSGEGPLLPIGGWIGPTGGLRRLRE